LWNANLVIADFWIDNQARFSQFFVVGETDLNQVEDVSSAGFSVSSEPHNLEINLSGE